MRIALPIVLRRVIASQASQALHARVDVGDVRLALWKGGVALEDVAVYTLADGDADSGKRDDGGSPDFEARSASSIIAFKRLAVELRYLPLFSKAIQLRTIQLDAPRVSLDRLASGDLNLMELVPKSEVAVEVGATPGAAESTATPTAAPTGTASPWKFGLDSLVLREGRLRFRDLALAGSEPVEVGIDQVTVRQIALGPGLYGEPAHAHVKIDVDKGQIEVAAQLRLLEKGLALTCDVNARRLPMPRARLYVPKVGWSDLQGEIDLALVYELETDTRNALHGTLALRNVAVKVPNIEDTVAGWKSLEIGIDSIDLRTQRVAVGAVTLDGAHLDVRPQGDQPFPLLSQLTAKDAAAPEAAPSPSPPAEAGEKQPEPPQPWEWSVARVRLTNSDVHAIGVEPPLDIGIDLDGSGLASAADATSHVQLGLAIGSGTVKLEGDLRIAEPAFGGSIQIAGLALPQLLAASGRVDPALLPSATLNADLAVAAGLPAKSGTTPEPDLLRVSGTVGVGDLRVVPPGQDMAIDAKALQVEIRDLAVPGIVPIGHKAPEGAAIHAAVEVTLQEPHVTRGGDQPLDFASQSIALGASDASVPAMLAGLTVGQTSQPLHGSLALDVAAPRFTLGGTDLAVGAGNVALRVPDATVVALPAGGTADGAAPAHVALQLDVKDPTAAMAGGKQLDFGAQAIGLQVSDLNIPGLVLGAPLAGSGQPLRGALALDVAAPRLTLAGADLTAGAGDVALNVPEASIVNVSPGATADGTTPAHVVLQLDLKDPTVAIAAGKQLNAGAQAIGLQLSDLSIPGLALGAPPAATGQPLHAAVVLNVAQLHAARGDGKEFSVATKSVAVPITELSVPGALGGTGGQTQPLRAVVGEVRLDAPAMRITRTKEGIVLPVAATSPGAAPPTKPTPAPAGSPPSPSRPLDLSIAAVRLTNGSLDFADRAVQPPFQTRFAPIEVDARNIRFPNSSVKPVRVDITTPEQGHITLSGQLDPKDGVIELAVNDLALGPFNPYATAYSPYGIGNGALTIKTTMTLKDGRYAVSNTVTLHQLDLSGGEGDSVFEQQFGIPLTLALALMRDTSGDIDLNVPVQVDQSGGATVDLLEVVRTALRQALVGAIESPLKLLGGVGGLFGAGGKGGAVAPAPIAFSLGRAEPTSAGAESAGRLAEFLNSRPTMAVQLETSITTEDVRWLREQALRAEFHDEGVFKRSVAFLTQRGPRDRIGSYLAARATGGAAELSPEDAATLQQWLDQRPAPSAAQLAALAADRLAAVESILKDKNVDPARITRGEIAGEPVEGDPVVKLTFQARSSGAPSPTPCAPS